MLASLLRQALKLGAPPAEKEQTRAVHLVACRVGVLFVVRARTGRRVAKQSPARASKHALPVVCLHGAAEDFLRTRPVLEPLHSLSTKKYSSSQPHFGVHCAVAALLAGLQQEACGA